MFSFHGVKIVNKINFFSDQIKTEFVFFFRTMSQTRKSNTGKSSSGRPIKGTQFDTDSETVVERSLQEENRDTKFLFYYSQALFSCYLNADNWPAKTTTDFKLSLKAGERTDMWHRSKPQNCIFLGKGPSKLVSEHQKQTLDRLKRGLPATHVPTQVQKSAAALPSNTADGARETATATQSSGKQKASKPCRALLFDDSPTGVSNEPEPTATQEESRAQCSEVCDNFKKFLVGHEQRMVRSRAIADVLKNNADKRRRKAVKEIEELVR